MKNTDYKVTGMSCAACSARVEKAVGALGGVSLCSVNLLTGSMRVEGEVAEETVIAAVEAAGYGCTAEGKGRAPSVKNEEKSEESRLRTRLFTSLGFLVLLMLLSMGHMLGLPLPRVFDNAAVRGLGELLLSGILLVINRKFFINGAKGLLHRAPNMDTLVALGAGVSFLWSTYVLFAVLEAMGRGDFLTVDSLSHSFYFESAGMIVTLITLGKMLEARAKGKTTDAIRALLSLAPDTTAVIRDGKELRVPTAEVLLGDTVLLRPGERVPVDGIVLEGEGAFDESALTGESIPVDKAAGAPLYAGTVGLSGSLRFRATGVGEDTALGRIVKTVKEASATKAPIAKLADRVSAVFVPSVLLISLVTLTVWLIAGAELSDALTHAIAVLVISCPCALGLATPVAVMVGSGLGAKCGILFKTAAALEETGRAKIVLLDKTGTLTEGKPRVTEVVTAEGVSENALLSAALAVEEQSEHPLARAVVNYAKKRKTVPLSVSGFRAHAGSGVSAMSEQGELLGGKRDFLPAVPEALSLRAEALAKEGKTPLYFSQNGVCLGLIAVADTVKEDSAAAISRLNKMGIRTVMLTGDHQSTAEAVAREVGISEVKAGVLPDGKAEAVKAFSDRGKVIMVGDGINDAPALVSADVGIAIGAGTDIAIDSADVVLTRSSLSDVAAAITLSRKTLRNVKQNLFWAFFYNIIGIPLAAGVFIPLLGWGLSPMFGALAMSLSSVTVVSNALRLRFAKIHENTNKDLQKIKNKGENKKMTITITIEGMMCPHCSGRVKQALEALACVESADVSHERGNAIVTLKDGGDKALLRKTVEDAGYKVTSI